MYWLFCFILLTGCGRESLQWDDLPQPPFDQPRPSTAHQLERLPAQYALTTAHPPGWSEQQGGFFISDLRRKASTPKGRTWTSYTAKLPFPVTVNDNRFAPPGMRVEVSGIEIPFALESRLISAHGKGWKLEKGRLLLHLPERPAVGDVVVYHPERERLVRRLVPALSDLAPSEFTRYSMTIGDDTRAGMLLTAPSQATWRLTLPERAHFKTWLAIEETPILDATSDGAIARLRIVDLDGNELFAHEQSVQPQTEFKEWRVDLAQFGGKEVDVVLETRGGETDAHDYVFFGSPVLASAVPSALPRRVIVIGLDTTRPDHMGRYGYTRDTTPELDRISKRFTVFENAWTPAPRTRPSFRTATTGRRPLEAVGATNIGEVFSDQGFATAGIVANIHLNRRFDFDRGFDWWSLDMKAKAQGQVDKALHWLRDNQHRETYLFLHIMDPHLFYGAPEPYTRKFVEQPDPDLPEIFNRWGVLRRMRKGQLTLNQKEHIVGLYDGEMAYMSHHLGRFLEAVEQLPGKTLIVVHSDHGEEFWEHDGYEHNHTLYNEVTKAVLWVKPPDQGLVRQPSGAATLADIAPTLYDYMGLTNTPATDGISLRPALQGDALEERPIGLGHLRYDQEQWGVVWKDHKYIIETASGRETLFDLVGDPGEKTNIASSKALDPWRSALASAHGMPVGPGWRIRVTTVGSNPSSLSWALPAPCVAAGIMDPESAKEHRANEAWGEQPAIRAEDVGRLELSDDRRSLTFHPGTARSGQIFVLFEDAVLPGGTMTTTQGTWSVQPNGTSASPKGYRIRITSGTVLLPPAGEAARIRALGHETGNAATDEIQLLESLGYVGESEPSPSP